MAINVFGHGIDTLPSFSGEWSHGGDRMTGPPCCRGKTQPCGKNCTDHNCCCDACRHTTQNVCDTGCCRCIPKAICAVFTPTSPTTTCKVRSWKLLPQRASDSTSRTTYTISVGGSDLTLSVGAVTIDSALWDYAACSWRMQYAPLSVDEEHEIVFTEDDINCLQAPAFSLPITLEVIVDGYPEDCPGTITFSAHTLDKIPYRNKWFGSSIEAALAATCGSCENVCTVLSVKRGDAASYNYIPDSCDEFTWDPTEGAWIFGDERIDIVEVDYQCYLQLTSFDTATLEGDLIAIAPGACSLGMVLTVKDLIGNWAKISCSPCSCWKHVCGTCRCICDTLCVIGMEGDYIQGPYELPWDGDLFQWGGDGHDLTISLSEAEDKSCQVLLDGFDEPVAIDNTCGANLSFLFNRSVEDTLAYGIKFYAGFCKACEGSCNAGTCLSECEEVPRLLFAKVSALDWTPMLGCEGFPASQCFEDFSIPIFQFFVPTTLNPAGEYRWQGSQTFQCRGCDTGGNPSFAEYRTNIATVDIGCDGLGSLTITGPDSGGTPRTVTVDIVFDLPCNGGSWELGPWSAVNATGSMLCCNEAGFSVSLSETP